jgi:hypothetical protein
VFCHVAEITPKGARYRVDIAILVPVCNSAVVEVFAQLIDLRGTPAQAEDALDTRRIPAAKLRDKIRHDEWHFPVEGLRRHDEEMVHLENARRLNF